VKIPERVINIWLCGFLENNTCLHLGTLRSSHCLCYKLTPDPIREGDSYVALTGEGLGTPAPTHPAISALCRRTAVASAHTFGKEGDGSADLQLHKSQDGTVTGIDRPTSTRDATTPVRHFLLQPTVHPTRSISLRNRWYNNGGVRGCQRC